jgi:hypothetical protein
LALFDRIHLLSLSILKNKLKQSEIEGQLPSITAHRAGRPSSRESALYPHQWPSRDGFALDDLQFMPVPEPNTLLLLTAALTGFGVFKGMTRRA